MKQVSLRNIFLIIILGCLFSCAKDAANNAASTTTGVGGSLSKFTIIGNYLYAVDRQSLYSYNITDPINTVKTNTQNIGFDVETIYPYKNRLFIGAATGMYIYSIDTASAPSKLGEARHIRSCDPVVANDTTAFVTLKGNTNCGPAESGLYVYDIKNTFLPLLKKFFPLNSPEGLGLQGNYLYICDNNSGLKIFNVSNPYNPVLLNTVTGAYYKDVIPYGDLLITYVTSGIMLFDISNASSPVLIKHITN